MSVFYDWPFLQVYFAKNVANIIFPFNPCSVFSNCVVFYYYYYYCFFIPQVVKIPGVKNYYCCCLLRRSSMGYHFHFVDSNCGSNTSLISVPFWHVLLLWSPRA